MNQREASKENWDLFNESPTINEIKSGSLQRIADATELMASNYVKLQNDLKMMEENRNMYKRWFHGEQVERKAQVRSLKGQITKLKNKIRNSQNEK